MSAAAFPVLRQANIRFSVEMLAKHMYPKGPLRQTVASPFPCAT
jgi:hypothetical protein